MEKQADCEGGEIMALHMVKGNRTVGVGMLPGRKRIALYIIDGNAFCPIAYFRNKESAIAFCSFFFGRTDL